jgi:hypothetical protein
MTGLFGDRQRGTPVLATISPAAELALQILTAPQGGLAPTVANPTFKRARECATTAVMAVRMCVMAWDEAAVAASVRRAGYDTLDRAAAPEEAAMVSDVVQQAIILH